MCMGVGNCRLLAVLTCGMVLLVAISSRADPAPALIPPVFRTAGLTQSLPVPGGFRLKASNGYSLNVLGVPAHHGRPPVIAGVATRKHQEVLYSAPATVTEMSIQASLGELGEISVTFHPSGKPENVRPKCGGKPVVIDSGYYEGMIDFHGEEGYTDVEATSAPGDIHFWLDILCPGIGGGHGAFLPGAELQVRNPGLGPEFSVIKNRPDAPARFEVSDSEYRGGISIGRSATMLVPAGTFSYDRRLQTATLRPPAPFAGIGHFDREEKVSKRWSGDLSIDMPGRADVPLTGSGLRASLVHAEWDNGTK